MEINGVAHIVFRVSKFEECIRFYDQLMPALGLTAVHRDQGFVYYIGGRTALAIRSAAAEHAGHAHIEFAPGIDHLCFRARSREDIDALYRLLQEIDADIVRPPQEGPWAPRYYSTSFNDPEGIRLEVNHVPGKGVFEDDAVYDHAPDHPLEGR